MLSPGWASEVPEAPCRQHPASRWWWASRKSSEPPVGVGLPRLAEAQPRAHLPVLGPAWLLPWPVGLWESVVPAAGLGVHTVGGSCPPHSSPTLSKFLSFLGSPPRLYLGPRNVKAEPLILPERAESRTLASLASWATAVASLRSGFGSLWAPHLWTPSHGPWGSGQGWSQLSIWAPQSLAAGLVPECAH